MKRKIDMKKTSTKTGGSEQVDEFMAVLEHPFKAEVQEVREIIKNVHKDITEQIKWKAPSFSYRNQYLVTLNLWEKKRVHLVFHNQAITSVKSRILEGEYKDRRMAYFADMQDIVSKRKALQKVLRDLIKLIDQHY